MPHAVPEHEVTTSAPAEPSATTAPATQAGVEVIEERVSDGKGYCRREVKRDETGKAINHGAYTSWWDNGSKRAEGQFIDGKQHGTWKYWHETGELKSEEPWVRGTITGVGNYWYPDGQKKQQAWVDGTAHGSYTVWHPNGQMAETGAFVDGKPDGKFMFWDAEGNVVKEAVYVNGDLISETEPSTATQPAPDPD